MVRKELKLIILLLLLKISISLLQISSLRLGQDSNTNNIFLSYEQGQYIVRITSSYIQSYTSISLCFRQRPITFSENNQCSLSINSAMYVCISYNLNQAGFKKYDMDTNYNISNTFTYIPDFLQSNSSTLQTFSFSLSGQLKITTNKIPFQFLNKDKIYQVISTSNTYFSNQNEIKTNYIQTFINGDTSLNLSNVHTDNLLMQRQWVCFTYNNVVSVLFLGGVIRSYQNLYMISIFSYDINKDPFVMWGGLSFSKSHASRDMLSIEPSLETVRDGFSLYAAKLFEDQSDNIGGSNDYKIMGSFVKSINKQAKYYYYTQVYRSYDTFDNLGDQIIRKKMENKYCFAAYYDYTIDSYGNYNFQVSATSQYYKHQIMKCFSPDLTLEQRYQGFSFIVIIFLILYHF